MADIGAYKAHQNMMKNPERRKAYIEAMKRRKKDTASRNKISKPSRSMMVDTTTSAYGDAGRGRPVPKYGKFETPPTPKKPEPRKNQKRLPPKEDNYGQFSIGGEAKTRGMGCAIKGGKFEGVF
jgi:hypothetical protein